VIDRDSLPASGGSKRSGVLCLVGGGKKDIFVRASSPSCGG